MLTLAFLASFSLAADPAPADDGGDVVTSRVIRAPADTIFDKLVDPRVASTYAPDRCMRKWTFDPSQTKDADFRVVYLMELFRRKLTASVQKADRPRRFEWNHHGNKGFVTRFSFDEVEEGTEVTVHTYIAVPPKPLQRYYRNKVQPRWVACYDGFLDAVAESVE